MKRLAICLAVAAMTLAGCGRDNKEFKTFTLSGEQCYTLTFDEEMGPWGTTVGQKNSYCVEWPVEGLLDKAAERELMVLCFGDSTSATVREAAAKWLAGTFFFSEENPVVQPVDSLDEEADFGYSYFDLESTCTTDSTLAIFAVKTESFFAGAAHGLLSVDLLTVDMKTGKAVHLDDLVTDTNLLCEAIAHAIQDLEVNSDVRGCLFDEFRDVERMPLPRNFMVDSARNSITVFYGLYEISCYACGIQEVVLPIFWLSKHVPLTPYAKRLFGPESYIE